jgi:hypothetical protein
VDVGVVGEEAFLCGVEEVGAVVDAGLLGGRTAEYLWLPGVAIYFVSLVWVCMRGKSLQMAVEVDDAHRAVLAEALR